MTKKDLLILYKQETGKEAPDTEDWKKIYIPSKLQDILLEYVEWLEEKLIKAKDTIELAKLLCSNERGEESPFLKDK
jgi:hypothetical protein